MKSSDDSSARNVQLKELALIFRQARGGLSLRAFVDKLDGAVAYSTLARVERGEIELPSDDILAAISPYTKPYKSPMELKAIAMGISLQYSYPEYDEVLAAAQALSETDRLRLIKALVNNLGRV